MLKLRKAGHAELERYFTLIEMDFDSEELIPRLAIHKGMVNGSIEFLTLQDEESGMDAAYAFMLTKGLYGYVIMKYMAVMPWFRDRGMGIEMMRALNKYYADKQGIVAELTEFEDPDPDRLKKLRKFFDRFGYQEVKSDYSISGVKANLLVKPLKGKADISPIAHRLVPDAYLNFMTERGFKRMCDIKPVK